MQIAFKKLHPLAAAPTYAHPDDACFDLVATTVDGGAFTGVHIDPHQSVVCGTGLAFDVPLGYAMLVFSRSGQGFKHGVRLANCVGVIDSGYRGEVMVKLTSDAIEDEFETGDKLPPFIKPGDRVAQAMLVQAPHVGFQEVLHLPESERGHGGFGSTGQ
jgi:dUTP pyrophosphatase